MPALHIEHAITDSDTWSRPSTGSPTPAGAPALAGTPRTAILEPAPLG